MLHCQTERYVRSSINGFVIKEVMQLIFSWIDKGITVSTLCSSLMLDWIPFFLADCAGFGLAFLANKAR